MMVLVLCGCGTASGTAPAPAESFGAAAGTQVTSETPPPIVIRSEAPPITISTEPPSEQPDVNGPQPSVSPTPEARPESPAGTSAVSTKASELLKEIPIKGRAPKTGYHRDLFGNGWGDPDRNGCDARNDILARDLTVHSYKPGTRECVVLTGTLLDPFTGKTIEFQRGQGTSNAVQIDHVVALSDAWQKGAQKLTPERRVAFSNDPLNLLAVDGPSNASKGDGDAATWLPPNRSFWCEYVTRQIEVKHKYDLWMTKAEHSASLEIITRYC